MIFYKFVDPIKDAEAFFGDLQEKDDKFRENTPVCECCGSAVGVMGDNYFLINDMMFCEDCIDRSEHDIYELDEE